MLSSFARQIVYKSDWMNGLFSILHQQPRILMLHGIGEKSLPVDVFRSQLEFLARNFQIVPLDEIWTGNSGSRPKVALTFDDGLRNNFTLAYPVLREFKAHATFFVCPGLIDSGRWLWNHECRARLACMLPEERQRFADSLGLENAAIEAVLKEMKYMPNAQRNRVERQLRDATPGFEPTEEQRQQFDIMSWHELKQIDPGIVTVGGHSTHHEILSRLESNQLDGEIAECGTWLERELGRPIRHFCYPDGAYNAEVRECVGRYFESAVTVEEGWVPPEPKLLELPRIPVASTARDLAWRMQRPHS